MYIVFYFMKFFSRVFFQINNTEMSCLYIKFECPISSRFMTINLSKQTSSVQLRITLSKLSLSHEHKSPDACCCHVLSVLLHTRTGFQTVEKSMGNIMYWRFSVTSGNNNVSSPVIFGFKAL